MNVIIYCFGFFVGMCIGFCLVSLLIKSGKLDVKELTDFFGPPRL